MQSISKPAPVQRKRDIQIIEVSNKQQLRQFIDFPHELYKDDHNYVPELFMAQRDMLTPGKHPSHKHIEFRLFMAQEKSGRILGRIAAIYNQNHIAFIKSNDGFFGFFDCVNDKLVSRALFDKVLTFLTPHAINNIIGPVNFSTNDPSGVLVAGFDQPPQIMMTYNKPYYKLLIEDYGFTKKIDLLAYWLGQETIPDRVIGLSDHIERRLARNNIKIRTINMKRFKEEVANIREIYNQAWEKNLGFVPMTPAEFDYVAKDMKLILDKDFILVAEKEGKLIGFTLALPNINEALIHLKKGRLFPTGIFKLLWYKSKIKTLRVLTLGVLEKYRAAGIEVCFYVKLRKNSQAKGYAGGEASWILEHNEMMNRELLNIKSKVYKKYRLYEKAIQET